MSIPSQPKSTTSGSKRWSCEVYCSTNGIVQSAAQTLLSLQPALDLVLSVVSCSSVTPLPKPATQSVSPQAVFLLCSRSGASGRYVAGGGRNGYFLTCWRHFSANRRSSTGTTLTTSGPI